MKTLHLTVVVCGLLLALQVDHPASANVLNMGGTRNVDGSWNGLASLETVPVGNINNAADSTTGYGSVDHTYNIGKYEVTAGQYTEFLNKVAGVDTYGLYNTNMWSTYGCKIERFTGSGTIGSPYQYRVPSDWANRPVNYVSFWDGCRFANWLHNGQPSGAQELSTTEDGAYFLNGVRDPTNNTITRNSNWQWAVTSEDEWYKAAYYNPGTNSYHNYPTSSNTPSGRDMNDASGNNANYYMGSGAYPIDSGKYTTLVGEFQNSDSPYGTFDQGGNVWEWNEAIMYSSYRRLRGGSFNYSYDGYLQASSRYRDVDVPTNEVIDVGLRLSQVPEPASMAILALGGVATLTRRRRA